MKNKTHYNLNFNKKNWKASKLGNYVREVNETSKNPSKEGLNCIVGLEHIDAETIHLKRFAELNNTTTFTKIFRKGQILFGRRRAYLKKAAQANFDGICSGDITVMEAKEGLLPELLPFLIHNDRFFDYAIKNSAGSLSPRVKFKDLAEFEFLLPPKEEQAKLAQLLWAADNVVEKDKALLEKLEVVKESITNNYYENLVNKDNNNFQSIIVNMLNGIYKNSSFHGKGIRLLNMGELFAFPEIEDQEMKLIDLTENEKKQFILKEGDLVFARRSLVIDGAGKCSIIGKHKTPITFESSIIKVGLDQSKIIPKFYFYYFTSKTGRKEIKKIIGFTTVAGITGTDLKQVKIPIINKDEQLKIVNKLHRIDLQVTAVKSKLQSSQALLKSLINEVFQ